MTASPVSAAASGTFTLGDLTVNRLGYGAMRITGDGIWGEPKDPATARKVLQRALELGVNFIDTADSYGPEVSERLIAEALHRRRPRASHHRLRLSQRTPDRRSVAPLS